MSNEKDMVKEITNMDEDFAQWYTDIVKKAELCDYSNTKGFLVIRPYGYAIWENIMRDLDDRFKKLGVTNVAMPLLISESLLQKEKDHVEGFAPECAWVTWGGSNKLEERLAVRPTSETVFCDYWNKVVKSHRDLPQLLCQWGSVVRWEKETRPFLRSREFFWHEGHTLHATPKDSHDFTITILDLYEDFIQNILAIPVLKGKKTEKERFAGAQDTYTVESLMRDGKALQSGTSHDFGDNFAKAFDIRYLDKNNQLTYATETSWAISSRIIGALIMVHGDNRGLKLPPRIAPIKARIIPIKMTDENNVKVAEALLDKLKNAGIKADIDLSDKTPGFKFSEQEMRGIPVRIEIGPKDIENNQVVLVRRDTNEKVNVKMDEVVDKLNSLFEDIQNNMFKVAKDYLDKNISETTSKEELIKHINEKGGFVKAMHCGDEECEKALKDETGISSRCILENEAPISDKCAICGKPAKYKVAWGRSY